MQSLTPVPLHIGARSGVAYLCAGTTSRHARRQSLHVGACGPRSKEAPVQSLPQQVVLYDKPGETGVVYATAYNEEQMHSGVLAARKRHGKCNARTKLASKRMSGMKK